MSKSKGEKNYIALSDDAKTIRKKIMGAVTDTGGEKGKMSDGVQNLFTLLKAFEKKEVYSDLKTAYTKKALQYKVLKETLADAIINTIQPIQKRRLELEKNPDYVAEILINGTKHAQTIAQSTLTEVRKKTGLL
jgi:tryptophanyl-tRNA synthetase